MRRSFNFCLALLTFVILAVVVVAQNSNTSSSKKTTTSKATSATQKLIDINSADKETLMSLSGVGDAYSQKIIDGRPYKAKNDLVKRGIIPQSLYNTISPLIVARQPKK